MDSFTIDEVNIDENPINPVIVSFQNGILQNEEEKKIRSAVFKNKRKTTVVAVAANNILYTGKIDGGEKLYNNCFLLRNKRTGKTRLIGMDSAILAPNFIKSKNILNDSTIMNTTGNTTMNELNKQFGSKRIKRRTEQQERMKMNVEHVKEQLENTVAKIEVDETELFNLQVDDNVSLYRPPINRDANTKEEVYLIDDLIPYQVLESLAEEVNNVLNSDEDFGLCPFILSRVKELRSNVNEFAVEKCKILIFVNYLISYLSKPAKQLTKRFKICETSADVNNHILDNFSVASNTGRARPISMRDKGICYVLVLLMIALNYELNIEELVKDLKMGLKKIQETCRILAFSSVSLKTKNLMTLKIPLPPPVSLGSRKRKK